LKELTERDRNSISSQIRWIDDIPRVKKRTNLPTGVLVAIHTQDFRRHIISNYWKIKNSAPRLAGHWRRGEPVEQIARHKNSAPIVIARIISSEIGVPKSDFRKMVMGTEIKRDLPREHRRMSSEVSRVVLYDYMDSPWSLEIYRELGREGERLLSDWLKDKGLEFKTEADIKGGQGVPTPDFLFDKPQKINGVNNISWIESKAFFGDYQHIRRHHRHQVSRYEKTYGEGQIVYWYGVSKEGRKEGPMENFLDSGVFVNRDGWSNLLETIPSRLVEKAIEGLESRK
jgi:hypothetical protein